MELGRATGFNVEVASILEKLRQVPAEHWNRSLLENAGQSAGVSSSRQNRKLWLVIKAERGVPVLVDAYRDKRSASRRAAFLRHHMPASDQVHLYDIVL
jgi:hypothetical protein